MGDSSVNIDFPYVTGLYSTYAERIEMDYKLLQS